MCICSFLSCILSWVSRAHLATIFLWTAGILCSASFVAPFWIISEGGSCLRTDTGLLIQCCATDKGSCIWVWENKFQLEYEMPVWFKVVQSLFLSGFILLLPVLFMSPIRFCSECGRMSIGMSRFFAVFTFLSACLFGGAVLYFFYNIVFGGIGFFKLVSGEARWSWACVMGVVGTCFVLASSMCWYLDSKREVGFMPFHNQSEQDPERRRILKR